MGKLFWQICTILVQVVKSKKYIIIQAYIWKKNSYEHDLFRVLWIDTDFIESKWFCFEWKIMIWNYNKFIYTS